MLITRSVAGLCVVLAAVVSAACGATASAKPATRFMPLDGWFTAETSEPREQIPIAWASNGPFVDDPAESSFPDRTVEGLSSQGIVLEAVGPWRYTGDADLPTASLPLTLSDLHCLANGYEGQPAPTVSFCEIAARLGTEIFNAYVYFGRNEPTPEMTAAANDVLATLTVSR